MGVSGFSLVWLLVLLLLLASLLLLECCTDLLLLLDVDWLLELVVSCWMIFSTSKLAFVTSLIVCLDSDCSSCNWVLLNLVLVALSSPLYAARMHPEAISDGLNIMNAYSETEKENETLVIWSRDRKLMEDILQQYLHDTTKSKRQGTGNRKWKYSETYSN